MLARILAETREEVERRKRELPLDALAFGDGHERDGDGYVASEMR